ncbi:MAG: thioredoxin domain-containing protein [Chitinophagales bacterium]
MKNGTPNLLSEETSPYLLQHAFNPVKWRPWNDAAWETARHQERLVIVSIGYSACHWCHVMERESFEDEEVAAVMNESFVSIKVDREERPDVDQIYMEAVQLVTGRGGWPLNAICLPDGRPVYAGTYFPKAHWLQLLRYFEKYYREHRRELEENANQLTENIRRMDVLQPNADAVFNGREPALIFEKIDRQWDWAKGGRKGAPKFMMPSVVDLLLRLSRKTGLERAADAALLQLKEMALGGIYDQVGGGFSRYSVDADWEIPHFEKMLYDNAQLLSVYAAAYKKTRNPLFAEVISDTCIFLDREMTAAGGGYYAALDADSEGEEGAFYVWSKEDLQSILGNDFETFATHFQWSEGGNFEGFNHLVRKFYSEKEASVIKEWRLRLFAERTKRVRPATDTKVLCGWNALAVKGFADAYQALGGELYRSKAIAEMDRLMERFETTPGRLNRSYAEGISKINGFLEDYACIIQALLEVYNISFDEKYLSKAKLYCDEVLKAFLDVDSGLFYYTPDNGEALIARKVETQDNVIPSSNSMMCRALWRLSIYFRNERYAEIASSMVKTMYPLITEHPLFYANWAIALMEVQSAEVEVILTGTGAEKAAWPLQMEYFPEVVMGASTAVSGLPFFEHKPFNDLLQIFICSNRVCSEPLKDSDAALTALRQL